MPGFVERIEVQATGRRRDRTRQVARRQVRRGQLVQHRHHGPLDGDRPRRPPIVELRAVAEVEAGQERTTSQGGGRGKRPARIRPGRAAPGPRGPPEHARDRAQRERDRPGPTRARRPRGATTGSAAGPRSPPMHPSRARATPPARRARTPAPRRPAERGSPRPCGYPRRVGRRPPAPPAARAAGCREGATAPWSRRNGTHSPGSLVTFQ